MSIKILKPALLTLLVSDGREGFRSLGIGPGGAMDKFAMKAANYLVGNDKEAVVELGYSSAEILFQSNRIVCVTGKGFNVQLKEESFPLWKPFKIVANSVLKLTKTHGGTWAYLAVAGGWKAQEWLGSTTTNLSAKAGGFQGRLLQKNDEVGVNGNQLKLGETKIFSWGISSNELNEIYLSSNEIRCIPSIETDLLSPESKDQFTSQEFVISSQSNRMGYRLNGLPLSLREKTELVSSPVDFGTIQLLPDGNLILLMSDHQTTGGYPRIASVIKADLSKLAQVMPNEKIKFKMVSLTDAQRELLSMEEKLSHLKQSCHERFKKYFPS